MSNVYFPAHLVLVLRRIANVISTLSISNHYLLPNTLNTDTPPESQRLPHHIQHFVLSNLPLSRTSGGNSDCLWPWRPLQEDWGWRLLMSTRTLTSSAISNPLETSPIPEGSPPPRTARQWSWRGLFVSSVQPTPTLGIRDPPPPPQKEQPRPPREFHRDPPPLDTIHRLMHHPPLYDPLRTPRYPIVLCHGLYGFDTRGPTKFPSLRMHYWANILSVLRETVRAEVIVTSVPGTGSIVSRAETLDRQLQIKARGRGINLLAHSMGGLDCRQLITHVKPEVYAPLSLTTVATPHRGSPFMDWCADNIGIGKFNHNYNHNEPSNSTTPKLPPTNPLPNNPSLKPEPASTFSFGALPSSFTTLLLSVVDSPAYANLTSDFLNDVFNPSTPDDPTVKYFSVAGRLDSVSVWHPFWFTKMVLDSFEEKHRARLRGVWEKEVAKYGPKGSGQPLWAQEREWGNDGLVTVQSAKWGEFLGIMEGCDHWEMRGARGLEFGVDLPAIPAIGFGNSMSGHRSPITDGWALPDWTRFMAYWKKEQAAQQDLVVNTGSTAERSLQREQDRAKDDAIVKSSTDKLSAMLDWLTDQVPSPSLPSSKVAAEVQARIVETVAALKGELVAGSEKRTEKEKKRNELETKRDLERFYVALCKKLYDEGF